MYEISHASIACVLKGIFVRSSSTMVDIIIDMFMMFE
jgi:hypothetical protein